MGNLGAYQTMTTLAKKVGGPVQLLALVSISSIATYKAADHLVKKGYKKIKEYLSQNEEVEIDWENAYEVQVSATDDFGLEMQEGTKFAVLEQDNEALLIAIKDKEDNPYMVSENFIKNISNYGDENEDTDEETEDADDVEIKEK